MRWLASRTGRCRSVAVRGRGAESLWRLPGRRRQSITCRWSLLRVRLLPGRRLGRSSAQIMDPIEFSSGWLGSSCASPHRPSSCAFSTGRRRPDAWCNHHLRMTCLTGNKCRHIFFLLRWLVKKELTIHKFLGKAMTRNHVNPCV